MSEEHLGREERIRRHAARIEKEELVEKTIDKIDTKMEPDEIKTRLAALRKRISKAESELARVSDPEFQEKVATIQELIRTVKIAGKARAAAIIKVFYLNQKHGPIIDALEKKLAQQRKLRDEEVKEHRKVAQDNKLTETEVGGMLRGEVKKFQDYCEKRGLSWGEHVNGVAELIEIRPPSPELEGILPLSWFKDDMEFTWRNWKDRLSRRGVEITEDLSGVDNGTVLIGSDARKAVGKCAKKTTKDVLGIS